MSRSIHLASNFAAGEVSPLLNKRVDYQRRRSGVQEANGFLPMREGGMQRTPGTVHWDFTREDAPVRLIGFEFNASDAVLLEFYPLVMRVRRYGALVMDGASPYELVHPYDADAIARLSWAQSADVIYLADGVLPIHRLSRFALDNWTIAAAVIDTGPFRPVNTDKAKKITASAATGSVTLTADFDIFTAGHVGSLIRLEVESWPGVALWQSGQSITSDILRMRNDARVYKCLNGNSGREPPSHLEGIERTGADPFSRWEFISQSFGTARITAVTDARTATATVLLRLPEAGYTSPDFEILPTYRWAEGAWSEVYGYPSILRLYDQRMFAARTRAEPRALWASAVGAYLDFAVTAEAEDAFGVIIDGDGSLNPIQWLATGARTLHIGAQAEEYALAPLTFGQAVAINNLRIGRDSSKGSASAQPVVPSGAPIFIARDRRRVFELVYAAEYDATVPRDLTLPARHLGASRFAQLVWQGDPMALLWVRRDAGDLLALSYDRGEDLLGWSVVSLAGGVVEDMVTTRAGSDDAAILVLVVRRTLAGETRRSIEVLAAPPGWDFIPAGDVAATHLFCASVQVPGAATDSFSVPHLAGQQVTVWADNTDHGLKTVGEDGTLTLDHAVARCEIGLFDASHHLDLFDPSSMDENGVPQAPRRGEVGPAVTLFRSQQGRIATITRAFGRAPTLSRSVPLIPDAIASAGIEPADGTVQPQLVGGYERDAGLRIMPVSGAALTVLAVTTIMDKGAA